MAVSADETPKVSAVDFLKRLRANLKDKVDDNTFLDAVRRARSHAGGVAKARKRQSTTNDDADNNSNNSTASTNQTQQQTQQSTPPETGSVQKATGSSVEITLRAAAEELEEELRQAGMYEYESEVEGHYYKLPQYEKSDPRVNYRDADNATQACGNCQFYCGALRCKIVEGTIRPDDTCDLVLPLKVELSESLDSDDTIELAENCPCCGRVEARCSCAMGCPNCTCASTHPMEAHEADLQQFHTTKNNPNHHGHRSGGGSGSPAAAGSTGRGMSPSGGITREERNKVRRTMGSHWDTEVSKNASDFEVKRTKGVPKTGFQRSAHDRLSSHGYQYEGENGRGELVFSKGKQKAALNWKLGVVVFQGSEEVDDDDDENVECTFEAHEGPGECPECGKSHGRRKKSMIVETPEDNQYFSDHSRPTFEPDLKLFMELQEFAEAPDWIPFLPTPGEYTHPRWGKISVTPERTQRMMKNFNDRVYQGHIPIDLEHALKASGAAGYIKQFKQNDDGSVDAQIEWTDLGKDALAKDRFRYFSPEWWEKWTHPTNGQTYNDVIVGGALTTRPFFKDSKFGGLRPLIASEDGLLHVVASEEFSEVEDWHELDTELFEFHGNHNQSSHGHGRGDGGGDSSSSSPPKQTPVGENHPNFGRVHSHVKLRGDVPAVRAYTHHVPMERLKVGDVLDPTSAQGVPKVISSIKASGPHYRLQISGPAGASETRLSKREYDKHNFVSRPVEGPYAMSEGENEMGMTPEETQRFNEMFEEVGNLNRKYEASEAARTAAETKAELLEAKLEKILDEDQDRRFAEMTKEWPGDRDKHLSTLKRLAKTLGESDEAFTNFVATMDDTARQMSESKLMESIGSSRETPRTPIADSVLDKVDEAARKMMSEKGIQSMELARTLVFTEQPDLYNEYETQRVTAVKNQ